MTAAPIATRRPHPEARERPGVALPSWGLANLDHTPLDTTRFLGAPLVAVVGNRHTQADVHRLVYALRTHPATAAVAVLQIASLHTVPRRLYPMAVAHIDAGYRLQLAETAALRGRYATTPIAEDSILTVCLDPDGGALRAFGLDTSTRSVAVAVFDRHLNPAAPAFAAGPAAPDTILAVLARLDDTTAVTGTHLPTEGTRHAGRHL